MSSSTSNYGLKRLLQGDRISEDGYQFSNADRVFIDAVLKVLEEHDHSGGAAVDNTPTDALELALDTTTGSLPANTRIYYKYTLVSEDGLETAASPEAFVNTPSQVSAPGAPSLSFATTGGTHTTGQYSYALSAYETTNTNETKATNFNTITVTGSTSTNVITLTLPSLPANADGFNVYRLKPGGVDYVYLASIDMTVATPPTTYDDDNSVTEDCNRFLPTANTTSTTNAVTVIVGGATPTVPDGFTWKLYRTTVAGDYSDSFLTHVVEETAVGSGITTPTYEDTGLSTSSGQPPTTSHLFGRPGSIAFAGVDGFPSQTSFEFLGTLETYTGEIPWVCEFPTFTILGVRATVDTAPDTQSLIVDINKETKDAATPSSTTIFTTQGNRPTVAVGENLGTVAVPDVTSLVQGDCLRADIDQADGKDLTITIYGYATFSGVGTAWE